MKNFVRTVCATAMLLVLSLGVGEACSPATKQIAKSVIDIGLALCIAAHPEEDAPGLKAICHYGDELAPAVEQLLSAQKKAAKSGVCGKELPMDGGMLPTVVVSTAKDGGKG